MESTLSLAIIFKFIFALAFVISLIVLASWLYRKYQENSGPFRKEKRLEIKDVVYIDQKTKAVLLNQDDKDHLILMTPSQNLVVHTQVSKKDAA